MTAQRFLRRNIAFVLAILMITSGLQMLATIPASATNPVGSIQFDGNDSMVYSTGAPGSQNTTIEFWMKQTSTGGIQRIFTTSYSFGSSNVTIRTQGNTCLVVAVANVEIALTGGTNYSCPTVNVWHHIALIGLGTTWNLYVDGMLARTTTWSDASKPNITDGDAWIGGIDTRERFNGYVSNFRYVIGTAVYTSNFSPPSPPLAATQSAGGSGVGAISSGTTLLLNTRYNNTLATAQADTSGNGRTPTVYGTPVASSESPPISVACSNGGSFTIVNNVVTSSTLDCAGAVVIPEGVTSIGNNAFNRNPNTAAERLRITSVTFSNSVTSIGQQAFYNVQGVQTLVIPGSVTTLDTFAFAAMGGLTSVTLNEGLMTIGNRAFVATNFTKLVIPNSVTTITAEAFFNNKIEVLSIGSGVTSIPDKAFSSSSRLKYLTIPNGVTSLGANAFQFYSKSTYIYCGTSLSSTTLSSAGLASSSKVCPVAPGPPAVDTATLASDTSATVLFLAPQHTGESAITSYTAVSSPDSIAASVNQSGIGSITVTGLRRGVSYTFAVYASNTGGAGASSDASVSIRTPDALPTITSATISGSPIYGQTLTANAVGVTGTSISTSYQWKRGGSNISGATNATYPLGSSDLSSQISVTITVTNATGSASATSDLTAGVSKATPTFSAWSNVSKNFGDSAFTVTAPSVTGSVPGSFSYSSATTSVISVSGSTLTVVGVGTSVITATFTPTDSTNYNSATTIMTVTVGKALQSVVSLSSLSSTYNPSNKSVSLTGSGGTGTGNYQYALNSSNSTPGCSVNGSTLAYTTAGTCVIAVTQTSDTNYLSRTDDVSFSISLASQTITFGSLSAKSYSSETFTVSATSSASLTVVFTSASQSVCTTSGVSGSTITLLSVGTCVINANQIGDANISPASQVSQNFTVNPRAITVTADSKTKAYGATDPTLTYTITTGSLVLGDAITGALTRAAGTDVGTYQIQQGALTTANNPKYAITFVAADMTITRATPALVLTYPNSNVAILRPGATDTPTVTTSSSSGAFTFATTAASSICTVDATTGVISLFGAGSCPVAMSTALTTNYIAFTETTTVTVALLSTSLVGIDPGDLVSMGQPFFAHASVDQAYSFSSGNNGASVAIPAGALDPLVPISIHLLTDSADQRAMIGGSGTSVLSVVVSWVAPNGSVPPTNTGKAISVTLTNSAIKKDAKVYSIIGNQSTLLGTATTDGSVTTLITEDPVLLVINPVVTTPVPLTSSSSSASTSGGSSYVMSVAIDNSAAISVANDKLAADKSAAELKASQEKAAAVAAEAAALKAAEELADKQARAAAELKASQEKVAAELRIAEELRLAKLAAEAELKAAAEKKAALDAAAAINKPTVTLYSLSSTLKLSAYDSAYLAKYVRSLKNGAAVTCIGYAYGKNPASQASQTLAKRQANAVCTQMKKTNKTLKTSIVIYPASKAPKAAVGAKWVGVSYRVDGIKNP